jgi:predicted nucleic acid-binding protein
MSLLHLLDTNVISETAKPKPAERVLAWLAELDELCISAITVYELARGIRRLHPGRRRSFLDAWFAELLQGPVRTLAFDQSAALAACELELDARRRGRVIETRDLFILASAKANGLRVATGNSDHFAGYGVVVHDPFSA